MEHVNGWCFRGIYKGGLWEDDLHVSNRIRILIGTKVVRIRILIGTTVVRRVRRFTEITRITEITTEITTEINTEITIEFTKVWFNGVNYTTIYYYKLYFNICLQIL